MDRYVIRETRLNANYPQGNQMMAFPANAGGSNMVPPENVFYGGSYANQYTNMHHVPNSSYIDVGNMNTPVFGQNMHPVQGQMMTGIDPRYLANYSDNSAQFIVTGQPMQSETGHVSNDSSFGSNYQNRSFVGAEKNKHKTFTPQIISNVQRSETLNNMTGFDTRTNSNYQVKSNVQQIYQSPVKVQRSETLVNTISFENRANTAFQMMPNAPQQMFESSVKATPKVAETAVKKENQIQIMSRAEKLQALHKSGPRAFSGPVEKVLKWHKALQDIGVFVFYEIVAKCVNVRPGESCSKNLVIRDDSGPAMQVVYYETDFLLPELKVPSTVRVIGRMMAGTCRLQAFNVRPATGDDVATLSRRAAVAAHHVAKLCKEFGINC